MSGTTLLLSDLHLPAAASDMRTAFLAFLRGPALRVDAVYILGDLFEYWLGDDLGLAVYADEVQALRAASDAGVSLSFIHGNRDFLVGEDFAAATGVKLLDDPYPLMLAGVPTLLSHGDLWCTDDIAYQRWRGFVRRRGVQRVFLRLPAGLRRRIGKDARSHSKAGKRGKPMGIMDVNERAIGQACLQGKIERVIHGHTHRPARHELRIQGRIAERWVLADWRPGRYEYLRCSAGTIERVLV